MLREVSPYTTARGAQLLQDRVAGLGNVWRAPARELGCLRGHRHRHRHLHRVPHTSTHTSTHASTHTSTHARTTTTRVKHAALWLQAPMIELLAGQLVAIGAWDGAHIWR